MLSPFDSTDASILFKAAIKDNNPVVFLEGEHELLYKKKFAIDNEENESTIGKAKIMKKGKDITIISYSRGLEIAFEVEEMLLKENIFAEIINLRSLKPIDRDTILQSIKKTNKVIVIEEVGINLE